MEALDVETAERSGAAPRQTLGGRLRRMFSRGEDKTGFSRLADDEDEQPAQPPQPQRPAGRWCPEEAAGPLSRLLFGYVGGILRLGFARPLQHEDLWDLAQGDEAEGVSQQFADHLASDPRRGNVLAAMKKQCGGRFVRAGALKLVHDLVMFTGPLFLQELLKALQERRPAWVGLSWAAGLAASGVLEALLVNLYFHMLFRVSLHLKVGLIDMLFAKSLRISGAGRARLGVGAISNLQSNDATKLYNLSQYLHMVWSGPLQILVVLALLVRVLHWGPALCGLAATVALIPASILTGRKLAAIRRRLMGRTDARIKLCSEVVTGVKAVKLYAWEDAYLDRIGALRAAELADIRAAALWSIMNTAIFFGGPVIISLASFALFSLLGYPLTADVAFPALALFNLLRFPVMMFPNQIMNIINARVALQRIQAFMEEGEMRQPPLAPPAQPHAAAIRIQDGSFGWAPGEPALEDVNLEVLEGQLLAVAGEVGSGKSSLLSAILGEMERRGGACHVAGRVAYTAQDPWILNASLRDNVLMGAPFDAERYAAVMDACALAPDLAQLPAGDRSEIGEKGTNLSGGQRHRVALARACYADADVVLLDDPLSAVDAHVGQHLWARCICGLLARKTRVLVTHHTQLLPLADRVAVLQAGRLSHCGTFDSLQGQVDFHRLEVEHEAAEAAPQTLPQGPAPAAAELPPGQPGEPEAEAAEGERSGSGESARLLPDGGEGAAGADAEATEAIATGPLKGVGERDVVVVVTLDERQPDVSVAAKAAATKQDAAEAKGRLVAAEERAVGRVQRSVYGAYIRAWGPLWLPAAILAAALTERGVMVAQNYWLKVWSDATADSPAAASAATGLYLGVYFAFAAAALLLMAARSAALVLGTLEAARQLHEGLLRKVVRMPMAFFDSQPTGRLLNRFSRDTEALDTSLGHTVSSFVTCLVSVAGAMLVVLAVTPAVLLAVVPLSVAYQYVQRVYIATSRELKRLDSLAMSPIFGHFSESLAGLLSLRAFRLQPGASEVNRAKLDRSNRVYWLIQNVNRWLSVRLELLGTGIVAVTAIVVSVFPTNPGLAGLALTSALNLTGLMNWMVRMSAELEVSMNSVERVTEYLPLPSEAPPVVDGARPPPGWPARGVVAVAGLCVRYRPELPLVIDSLSFATRAAEKVGIAGRTGCGKSTLMMALYRIVEPCAGSVTIDGLDALAMGLADLRGRLALVPQDPVIFSGSVRSNLDPFGQAGGDAAVLAALRQAGMADAIAALPGGLEAELCEGGSNLSTGQRQLLCMARALLRRSRVLVLDEATSNVDPATDALIQATIRSAFADCTTLTIAHRLHTIMDSDRVLILDAGRLREFDAPAALLKDKSSAFAALVADSAAVNRGSRQDLTAAVSA